MDLLLSTLVCRLRISFPPLLALSAVVHLLTCTAVIYVVEPITLVNLANSNRWLLPMPQQTQFPATLLRRWLSSRLSAYP